MVFVGEVLADLFLEHPAPALIHLVHAAVHRLVRHPVWQTSLCYKARVLSSTIFVCGMESLGRNSSSTPSGLNVPLS